MEVQRRNGTYKDLEGVYVLSGAGVKGGDWLRFWYRAGVRNRLRFQVSGRVRSGSIPISQETWRLGDPVEELDVVQSLQAFPVIVPNMSTRKWMKSYTFSSRNESSTPDLLIVIDSSGSMTWSFGRDRISGAFHIALISAFAAVDFAYRQGKKVGVINFSGSSRTCDWTREKRNIERTLMQYQGSGTVMPVREIKAMCKKAESENMILVITDAQVSNWNPFVKTIKGLSRKGHSFFIFHIGSGKSSGIHEKLEKAGGTVIPVNSPDNLFDLVIRQVRGVYSN
jgi:Mg-chelatase subunit ChlD